LGPYCNLHVFIRHEGCIPLKLFAESPSQNSLQCEWVHVSSVLRSSYVGPYASRLVFPERRRDGERGAHNSQGQTCVRFQRTDLFLDVPSTNFPPQGVLSSESTPYHDPELISPYNKMGLGHPSLKMFDASNSLRVPSEEEDLLGGIPQH